MTADEAIARIEKLFHHLNCPVRLSEMGIPGVSEEDILASMIHNKVDGGNMRMKEADYRALIGLFQ